jgi:5-methylcytosine-specific restriction protein A
MTRRALKVCSVPGCPNLTTAGRCDDCRRTADKARGTAAERGYTSRHHRVWRRAVLRRNPICVIPDCHEPAVHADHHPLSVRQLQALGINPWGDPRRGRGLCASHHSRATAEHQPGGFNLR